MLRLRAAKRREEATSTGTKRAKLKTPKQKGDRGGSSDDGDLLHQDTIYHPVSSSHVTLGEADGKDEAEKVLEELVIGGEDRLVDELNKQSVSTIVIIKAPC